MPKTVFRTLATEMDEKLILYDLEPSKCGQKNYIPENSQNFGF